MRPFAPSDQERISGRTLARALRHKGIENFALLELEDEAGGNSRGGAVNGVACPLGAHYLPLPSDDAPEVQDLLEELGLRQRISGRWIYDERHLCHSPHTKPMQSDKYSGELVLTPLELINRIAQLVPPPRTRRHRYYRVLAPNSPLRAALIARIVDVFQLICPNCGGQMRIIAFITFSADIQKILEHIGVAPQAPRITPARGPPLWSWVCRLVFRPMW